jgi:hypothetical protein
MVGGAGLVGQCVGLRQKRQVVKVFMYDPRCGQLARVWRASGGGGWFACFSCVAPTEQLLTVLNEVLDLAPEMAQVGGGL